MPPRHKPDSPSDIPARRPPTRSPKRSPPRGPARGGSGRARQTRSRRNRAVTRTVMKVSSEDGMRSWVTLQLPAWLMALVAIVIVVGTVAILSSPELAARLSLTLYQLSQWLRGSSKP